MLCKYERCSHYWEATKYPKKCFYQPQCWRGKIDILIAGVKMRLKPQVRRKP